MSLGVHYNEDVAMLLKALQLTNEAMPVAHFREPSDALLFRAGFRSALQMVATGLGIDPEPGIRNPHPEILAGVSSGNLQS